MDFDWSDRDIKKVYEQRKHMVKQMVQSILFLEKFKACLRIIYDSYYLGFIRVGYMSHITNPYET